MSCRYTLMMWNTASPRAFIYGVFILLALYAFSSYVSTRTALQISTELRDIHDHNHDHNHDRQSSARRQPQQPTLTARQIWNAHRITYDVAFREDFERHLRDKSANDDRSLVSLVLSALDPPSTHPKRKLIHSLFQTPQAKVVNELFKGQKGLFYVEAGALDGERSSNTVWLEVQKDWQGLLVEVDPHLYTQLRGKARKAFTINACLSGGIEKLYMTECWLPAGGCGKLGDDNKDNGMEVPCFSLYSMMLALNRTTIDYFSLDVEGHEQKILDTVPWDKLNIRVLSLEFNADKENGQTHDDVIEFWKQYFKPKGYTVAGLFEQRDTKRDFYNHDIMFIKDV